MILYSHELAGDIIGQLLDASLGDLGRIQSILDTGSIQSEATRELQCLGMAFGKVFVENNQGLDWWMVEDEFGRDHCVRYEQSSLLLFPQTVLSKRIEEHQVIDVSKLYYGITEEVERIKVEHLPDD